MNTCHLPPVPCPPMPVTHHLSPVPCPLSPVTCHIPDVRHTHLPDQVLPVIFLTFELCTQAPVFLFTELVHLIQLHSNALNARRRGRGVASSYFCLTRRRPRIGRGISRKSACSQVPACALWQSHCLLMLLGSYVACLCTWAVTSPACAVFQVDRLQMSQRWEQQGYPQ